MKQKTLGLILTTLMVILITISGFVGTRPYSSNASDEPHIQHVVLIMMENKDENNIVGNKSAPYENYLIRNYAFASNFYAIDKNGLLDYLALVDGADEISNPGPWNTPHQSNYTGPSLFNLLDNASLSWKGYDEAMPSNCYYYGYPQQMPNDSANEYWPIHNAIPYLTSIHPECLNYDLPFSNFSNDLLSNSFPNFTTITPNVCDDMNRCTNGNDPIQTGDSWLNQTVSQIIKSPYSASTVIFITFDNEGDATDDTITVPIPMTVIGPSNLINYNDNFTQHYTDYSFLATVENIFCLGNLGLNDNTATPMSAIIPSASPGCTPNSTSTSSTTTSSSSTTITTSSPNTTTTSTSVTPSTSKNTGTGLYPIYLLGGAVTAAVVILGTSLFLRRKAG